MATKLRALYQRRKGRDLFDLWHVFTKCTINTEQVLTIFQHYCTNDGITISKELFQNNMALKKLHKDFQVDMNVLLSDQAQWNFEEAFEFIHKNIINKLP